MNAYGEDLPRCYFHPKQAVVGICSLCLRERLLILASKQGHQYQTKDTHRSLQVLKGKLTVYLPRFFVLSSIFHCLNFRHQRTNDTFDEGSVPSPDSFISIKFDDEQNQGHEIRSSAKPSLELVGYASHQALPRRKKGGGNTVEYVKQPGKPRWRTRIGRLFKLARWKGSPGQARPVRGADRGKEVLDMEPCGGGPPRNTGKELGRIKELAEKRHYKLPQ